MRGSRIGAVALLAAVMVLPLSAGEGHKCKASTQDCLDYMASSLADRGWVGIETDDDSMRITRVVAGSPAEAAGFAVGDMLVAADGVAYADANEEALKKIKQSMTPGTKMTFTVERNGARQDLDVKLASLPEEVRAQWVGQHMLEHAHVKMASK